MGKIYHKFEQVLQIRAIIGNCGITARQVRSKKSKKWEKESHGRQSEGETLRKTLRKGISLLEKEKTSKTVGIGRTKIKELDGKYRIKKKRLKLIIEELKQ